MSPFRLFGTRLAGTVVALAVLLAVLAVVAPGPLIAIRPVNPATGKVILSNAHTNASTQDQKFAVGDFVADDYVSSIWKAKVMPWVTHHAMSMTRLLSALEADRSHAEQTYGVLKGGNSYSFLVHGQAKVMAVEQSTPVGKIKLANPDWHEQSVALYAGPLVFGTALRDALPFLSLNDFTNQVQYASVGKSMNKRAIKQAYAKLKTRQLKNKTIEFTGAFTESGSGSINIVPLSIKVVQ